MGQMKKMGRSTLVWAVGMREWVRLDSLRPVMWYILNEGSPVFTPSKRGEVSSTLLLKLVKLRPSVDIHGAPVRPVPRAKRVLASARCLPHIAQVTHTHTHTHTHTTHTPHTPSSSASSRLSNASVLVGLRGCVAV